MLIFKYDDSLKTGIEMIDQQHKEIITSANLFFISYKGGKPVQRLQECISFLEQYVQYHFQSEEAFQNECNYPGFLTHQAQHSALTMQFKFHATRIRASSFSKEVIDDFYQFLNDWVIAHILKEDLEFAEYYRLKSPEPH